MVRTVVREHHWTPEQINNLYLDDVDHEGLEFWDQDVREVYKSLKKK